MRKIINHLRFHRESSTRSGQSLIINYNRGFTLIEVLIASAILALTIGATIGLARSALARTGEASIRSTALALTQEAVELVRNARDSTYVDKVLIDNQPNHWLDIVSGNRQIDPNQSYKLVFEQIDGTNFWRLEPGEDEISIDGFNFKRQIFFKFSTIDYVRAAKIPVETESSALIRQVDVIVGWGNDNSKQVSASTVLTDWRFGL